MLLTYGGVELQIVNTNSITRRAVLSSDNSTYLWTEWIFDVDAVLSPAATSFATGPDLSPGQDVRVTDAAIRGYMMQQRRVLKTDVNGSLLQSPDAAHTVDCCNGPTPIDFMIKAIRGIKTFLVNYKIKACVNECANPSSRSPLLSHRWRRWVDTDHDHFSVVHTRGEAVFRMDELVRLGRYPDEYRRDLFHPIPPNFVRESIQVSQNSEGNTVDYIVTDREMPYNLGSGCQATRVECYQTHFFKQTGLIQSAANQAVGYLRGVAHNPVGRIGGAIASWGASELVLGHVTGGVFDALIDSIPKYYFAVNIKVWGNRLSTREALQNLAFAIATARLTLGAVALLSLSAEMILTHDVCGRMVELQVTLRTGPEELVNLVGSGTLDRGFTRLRGNIATEEINSGGFTLSREDIGNPAPPKSNSTRGTFIGLIAHQLLSEPCATPPAIPAYQNTTDQNVR